jgi:Predicted pPIWI-associating nuclease
MTSPHPATDAWATWWDELGALSTFLGQGKAALIAGMPTRDQAKVAVQHYFRQVRPHLIELAIDPEKVDRLDSICQRLLKLASVVSRRATYRGCVRELAGVRNEIDTRIEINAANVGARSSTRLVTATESSILSTLERIIPSTALSYRQVLQDLAEPQRVSYRGTAAEVREVLRELLDHLAPDDDVLKSGVKVEKGLNGLTMKQKATFILKARGVGESTRKTAQDAVEAVQDSVSALARSVYTRGSLSTHIVTTRKEVLTLKGYADAVLADLLQIHEASPPV